MSPRGACKGPRGSCKGRSMSQSAALVVSVSVGFCGVKTITFRDQATVNLFYRLDPTWWGQGTMPRSLKSIS